MHNFKIIFDFVTKTKSKTTLKKNLIIINFIKKTMNIYIDLSLINKKFK